MPEFTAEDLRRIVANRHRYLALLVGRTVRKPEIESELDVARSTVDYAVRELLECGLIDRTPEGFRATQFGELVHATFERYHATLEGTVKAFDALAHLRPGTLDAPELFDGADVVLPEAAALDRPLRRYIERIRRADRFRGVLPVVLEPYVEAIHERTVTEGRETELVMTPDVLRHLATTYVDRFSDVLGAEACSIFETPDNIAVGLAIFEIDDRAEVGVLVHDDKGVRGLVLNDSVAAVSWAEERYERYRRLADPVFTRSPVVSH